MQRQKRLPNRKGTFIRGTRGENVMDEIMQILEIVKRLDVKITRLEEKLELVWKWV